MVLPWPLSPTIAARAAVFDFQVDVGGDFALGIADRQIAAAHRGAFARFDQRGADVGGRLVAGDFGDLQSFELFALRAGPRRRAGAGLVLGDELFQVPALGQDGGVRALVMLAALALILQKGIDLAGKHRQLAARQIERVVAGRGEEGPIVRDDQAGFSITAEKVFQQDLRAQVEKVRRFVEQQQVRLVQQQGRQLHARLPAARELGDRPFR